jgi:UPF0042 nucleotide-binding protein
MASKRAAKASSKPAKESKSAKKQETLTRELVILTGMSGSGKASALKAFEDLGYYSVDNLPLELIPRFADLVLKSAEITRAAMVVDVREGIRLDRFPAILKQVRKVLPARVVFLEASEEAIVRRFSETRRPHPSARNANGLIRCVTSPIFCWTPRASTSMTCARTSMHNLSAAEGRATAT